MVDCHDAALKHLAHRERSVQETRNYLKGKGFQNAEIEKELGYLQELHYLDDERYCESMVRYGKNKGRGPLRIQMDLKEKGIDSALIQYYLGEGFSQSDEKIAAWNEVEKVLRGRGISVLDGTDKEQEEPPPMDEKLLAKIGRKLSANGYHTDVIYEILGILKRG